MARTATFRSPSVGSPVRHCQIFSNDGERFFLKDLGSQNGTYVNRRRIRGFYELKHTDQLNFAEYTILFLSDAGAYRGDHQPRAPAKKPPAPDPELEAGETIMPKAYEEHFAAHSGDEDSAIRPVDYDDPDDERAPAPPVSISPVRAHQPKKQRVFAESPDAARKRRGQEILRDIQERRPEREIDVQRYMPDDEPTDRGPDKRKKKKKKKKKKAERKEPAKRRQPPSNGNHVDIPDLQGDPKREAALDSWYSGRNDQSRLYDPLESGDEDEESDSMIPRSKSSISLVLQTMTVDKDEVDEHLKGKVIERRFYVDAVHKGARIFSGPLNKPVTILGTDREADIQLKGRYVAGRHSLLVRVRDSLLLVRLGSSSVARVNGLPKLQAFIKSGDVIQIDETEIRVTEE